MSAWEEAMAKRRGEFVEEIYVEPEPVYDDGKTRTEDGIASARMLGCALIGGILAWIAIGIGIVLVPKLFGG